MFLFLLDASTGFDVVGTAPDINSSSSVLPTLEWPSSDEDVQGVIEANHESDDDSEVEVPLSAVVSRHRAMRSVRQHISDNDNSKACNLGSNASASVPAFSAASALDIQSDSEDEVPLARNASRGFPARPKPSINESLSPSPSPSPVTPRSHAQSAGTPRAWVGSSTPLCVHGDRKMNGNGLWGAESDGILLVHKNDMF